MTIDDMSNSSKRQELRREGVDANWRASAVRMFEDALNAAGDPATVQFEFHYAQKPGMCHGVPEVEPTGGVTIRIRPGIRVRPRI